MKVPQKYITFIFFEVDTNENDSPDHAEEIVKSYSTLVGFIERFT